LAVVVDWLKVARGAFSAVRAGVLFGGGQKAWFLPARQLWEKD
jgi:hypothetical protein